ncbi:MAG TPA: 4Fe-4S dicluster domain-containing protein [Anaerolineales bacterium]|nr:4Fe-4S dicluster domain-containing protein [Anaerolineales bacterium]
MSCRPRIGGRPGAPAIATALGRRLSFAKRLTVQRLAGAAKGKRVQTSLITEVDALSHQQVELCYHCHKCSAGCPLLPEMTFGPDRLLRMVQVGDGDRALRSRDVWLCSGCATCATRCPNDIDISAVMDALRQIAVATDVPAGERDALLFHRLFLGVVRRLGRSHEAAMLGLFKVLSRVPIYRDVPAGIGLFLRGKVPVLPRPSGAASEVRRLFERSQ